MKEKIKVTLENEVVLHLPIICITYSYRQGEKV